MRKAATSIAIAALALAAQAARADSITDYVHVELGAGIAHEQTLNDGVWYQQGNPTSRLNINAPALVAGLTGTAWQRGSWSVDWHLDYVWLGTVSASCQCVADNEYNAHTHQVLDANAPTNPFVGSGHTQGIALTLAPGYSWGKWRFAVEGGPWIFWQTWSELAQFGDTTVDASHKTVAQLGYVAGARVERGPFALSYRYYSIPQKWNPFPGLVRGAHTVTLDYRF